jgi:ABC-2 type transport system permease protein
MVIWTLAKKDLRLLLRDRRALVILIAMPFLFILVLGVSLGEGFGQKPDDRLRISFVDLDKGEITPSGGFPTKKWSQVVLDDLLQTAGIRLEELSREEAEQNIHDGKRAAVLVFGPDFSRQMSRCSFLDDGINPMSGDGVSFEILNVEMLRDKTQGTAASIIDQVAQVSMLRVVLPWMIGRAFEKIGDVEFIDKVSGQTQDVKFTMDMMAPKFKKVKVKVGLFEMPLDEKLVKQVSTQVGPISLSEILPLMSLEQKRELGQALQKALQDQFSRYKLTGKTWSELTLSGPKSTARSEVTRPKGEGMLRRSDARYQVLVPSYTVMFAFFLVLTVGWLIVAERREGTLKRLRAAPLTRAQILGGKMIPCLLLSLSQGAFLLIAGKVVFNMSWGPHPLWLVPVVICTSLAAVGMAMLVASVARTETQVAIYGTLLVLILAGVSGCLMPRELMPEQMKQLSRVTPHAWALDAYAQLLLSPEPNLMVVAQACAVLVGFGAMLTGLAWGLLRLD